MCASSPEPVEVYSVDLNSGASIYRATFRCYILKSRHFRDSHLPLLDQQTLLPLSPTNDMKELIHNYVSLHYREKRGVISPTEFHAQEVEQMIVEPFILKQSTYSKSQVSTQFAVCYRMKRLNPSTCNGVRTITAMFFHKLFKQLFFFLHRELWAKAACFILKKRLS